MIYIVLNEGELVYASYDEDEANGYAYSHTQEGVNATLEEWGNDDHTDKDLEEAAFHNGFDGGFYSVIEVDVDDADEYGNITLDDGTEVCVEDILDIIEQE